MVILDSFPFLEDSDGGPAISSRQYCESESEVQYLGKTARSAGLSFSSSPLAKSSFDSKIPDSTDFSDLNCQGYFKCQLCNYQTKIHSLLQRHVVKHSLDSDFRCPACDFRENDSGKFVDHIGSHQSGRMVRCCFCPRKMSRGKLKSHIRIHRPVELYDCSMCQFSTNYEKTIKRHMDLYHSKEYACNQCDMVMTKHELHWHMKFIHGSTETQYDQPYEQHEAAPVSAPSVHGLNSTVPIKTSISPNQSISPRKFHNKSKISHKTSFTHRSKKMAVLKKQFNCGKCDYRTSFKKLLRNHRAKHLLNNSLACSKCDFEETATGKFAEHLLAHSPEGVFECCFCSFQTPRRSIMSNHLCTHKPLSMFDCSECEFSAKRPASLRVHTANIHRKKIRCGYCAIEVSHSGWYRHRIKCRQVNGGDSVKVESASENQPGTNSLLDTAGEGLNENGVPCDLCKKLYAKSYVKRHYKKCRGETDVDLEPDPDPDNLPESNDEQGEQGMSRLTGHMEQMESPGSVVPDLLPCTSVHTNLKKPFLRCYSCSFKTKKKRLLMKHVQKHLIDFRLTCPKCGHKELSASRFAHHILQHGTNSKSFQCCFCPMSTYSSKRSYICHLERHRPINIFDCSNCEYSSNRADSVRLHWKTNHAKKSKCQHCGKVMRRVRLDKHLSEAHAESKGRNELEAGESGADAEVPSSHLEQIKDTFDPADGDTNCLESASTRLTENDEDPLECTECPFQTKIQSLMNRHAAKHIMDVPFVCPLCGFEHLSSRKFANHWDKHECNSEKKFYQCCFCDALIKKKNCLKGRLPQHIEDHRAVALQDCPKCEFSSRSQYELSKHYKNQHVKKCECLVCREVMTIYEYSLHTDCKVDGRNVEQPTDAKPVDLLPSNSFIVSRRQSAEVQSCVVAALNDPALSADSITDRVAATKIDECRPEVTKTFLYCNSCNYKTQRRHLLIRHVQKHLIDVPFTCSICSYETFHERTFAHHIFGHTDSLNCHFCSFTAKTVSIATRHYVTHKIVAMHDCPKCEYTSTYKDRTAEHLMGSHTNKPRCSYCGKCMSKDEIRAHEKDCRKSLRACVASLMAGDENMTRSNDVSASNEFLVPVQHCDDDTDVSHKSGVRCDVEYSHQLNSVAELHSSDVALMNDLHCADEPNQGSGIYGSIHSSCSDEVALSQEDGSSVENQPTSHIETIGSAKCFLTTSPMLFPTISPVTTFEAIRHHPPVVDSICEESRVESSDTVIDLVPPSINRLAQVRELENTACSKSIVGTPSPADPGLGNGHQDHLDIIPTLKVAEQSASELSVNSVTVSASSGQNRPDKFSTSSVVECDPHKPQCRSPVHLPDELNLSSSPGFNNASSRGDLRVSELASVNGDSCKHCGKSFSIGNLTGTMVHETCAGSSMPLA